MGLVVAEEDPVGVVRRLLGLEEAAVMQDHAEAVVQPFLVEGVQRQKPDRSQVRKQRV
jgi:hypothetical protein